MLLRTTGVFDTDIKLTEKFNTAFVKKGELFSIVLEADAGYMWGIEPFGGKAKTSFVQYFTGDPKDNPIDPNSRKKNFVFKAEETGTGDAVAVLYKRPSGPVKLGARGETVKSQNFSITVK